MFSGLLVLKNQILEKLGLGFWTGGNKHCLRQWVRVDLILFLGDGSKELTEIQHLMLEVDQIVKNLEVFIILWIYIHFYIEKSYYQRQKIDQAIFISKYSVIKFCCHRGKCLNFWNIHLTKFSYIYKAKNPPRRCSFRSSLHCFKYVAT